MNWKEKRYSCKFVVGDCIIHKDHKDSSNPTIYKVTEIRFNGTIYEVGVCNFVSDAPYGGFYGAEHFIKYNP